MRFWFKGQVTSRRNAVTFSLAAALGTTWPGEYGEGAAAMLLSKQVAHIKEAKQLVEFNNEQFRTVLLPQYEIDGECYRADRRRGRCRQAIRQRQYLDRRYRKAQAYEALDHLLTTTLDKSATLQGRLTDYLQASPELARHLAHWQSDDTARAT